MKTTIDISDNILIRSKALAQKEHVTLRELVEEGLQEVLQRKTHPAGRGIKPVTFKGRGLSPSFQGASWDQIRKAAYEGRGT